MQKQGQSGQQNADVLKNPQTGQLPQVKGPEMNERDFINDILATEKYITDNFNVFSREASNQTLHQDTMDILSESHQAARNLFNMMYKKGWYKMTVAPQQDIQQTTQQFQNYQTQEPY